MRSGSEFWVTKDTAAKIEKQLIEQDKHTFIKITELDRTINTADVVEICTPEQMDDRNHLKNKDWCCDEMKWHARGEKCFCKKEKAEAKTRKEREAYDEEMSRPLTPEQEARRAVNMRKTRVILEEKGILIKKISSERVI
ncbi:MAG: hypothetical protein WAV09_04110 [Minisyncoccia bacterium]